MCGFETGYDTSLAIDKKLGEVPLDVRLGDIVRILLSEHPIHEFRLHAGAESHESLLLLEIGKEWQFVRAVDLYFLKLRKLGIELEVQNCLISAIPPGACPPN